MLIYIKKNYRNKQLKEFLFLCVTFLVLLFSNGRWFMTVVAWISPILMLRVSRALKPMIGYLVLLFVMAIANPIAFLNFVSSDSRSILYYLLAFLDL